MRRHTKPCLSLYLFLSFFFLSRKSNSLEPLLGDDSFTRLPLRSASSSSVASLSMETEARWLQRLVGSEDSEPCRINAGTLLPLKFEVLTLSTSSLLLKEVALMQRLDCSREVAGYASWIQLIAAMVIAYHSASSHHGTPWFLGVEELNPSLHTHRG